VTGVAIWLASRAHGGVQAHWPKVLAALLIGVGAPVQVAGGWAAQATRPWWLLSAGVTVCLGTLLSLLPTPLSRRVWGIPVPVDSFTGREAEIDKVRALLTRAPAGESVSVVALTGLPGVGKSQVARAYGAQFRRQYRYGWQLPAVSPEAMRPTLGLIAQQLSPTGAISADTGQLPLDGLLAQVHQALATRRRWLLVFDNAAGASQLLPFLPSAGRGHVLITTRDARWPEQAAPRQVQHLPVALLTLEAAIDLLVTRSRDPDQQAAKALAEELGRLPLALEQAAIYVAGHDEITLAAYADRVRDRVREYREELLAKGEPLGHETVAVTFSLVMEQLTDQAPAAAQLLTLCAFLAPDQLPIRLLCSAPTRLPDPLATSAADLFGYAETLEALTHASLLIPVGPDDAADLHRLLHQLVRQRLPSEHKIAWATRALELLAALLPGPVDDPDHQSRFTQLLPHLQASGEFAIQYSVTSQTGAALLARTAGHLYQRDDLLGARELYEQALAMRRRIYGEDVDHPEIASSLHNLAVVLSGLGELRQARELYEQALAMQQRIYGQDADHPAIADTLNNLAGVLDDLGELRQARELYEQALAMQRRIYGQDADHPAIADTLNNLAAVLRNVGDRPAAAAMARQAAAVQRRLDRHQWVVPPDPEPGDPDLT
jgi:tetratricopeptide (TPR) repeat protein